MFLTGTKNIQQELKNLPGKENEEIKLDLSSLPKGRKINNKFIFYI